MILSGQQIMNNAMYCHIIFFSHTSHLMFCAVSYHQTRLSIVSLEWHRSLVWALYPGPWITPPSPPPCMERVTCEWLHLGNACCRRVHWSVEQTTLRIVLSAANAMWFGQKKWRENCVCCMDDLELEDIDMLLCRCFCVLFFFLLEHHRSTHRKARKKQRRSEQDVDMIENAACAVWFVCDQSTKSCVCVPFTVLLYTRTHIWHCY